MPDACRRLMAISISSAFDAASDSLLFAQQLRLRPHKIHGESLQPTSMHNKKHTIRAVNSPAIENIGVGQKVCMANRITLVQFDHARKQIVRSRSRVGITALGEAIDDCPI